MSDAYKFEGLSKKERKKLKRQIEREEQAKTSKQKQFSKYIIYFFLLIALILGAFYLWKGATTPKPGEKFPDLGRDHVEDISNVTYNSNPPTSGTHFAVWAKRGVYDRVISDGYLIHSLEHGYIVISYHCDVNDETYLPWKIHQAYAHEDEISTTSGQVSTDSGQRKTLTRNQIELDSSMSFFTPENPPKVEVELPKEFQSEECKSLVRQLSVMLKEFQRIVIVPRQNMDARIALSAWTKLDKFNEFDEERIRKFAKAYHNRGPERTDE